MKRFGLGVMALLTGMHVCAQEQAVPSVLDGVTDVEQLEAARARETETFNAQQAECYARFAVNDCLKKLQSRHLDALAGLKRQETRIHDRERALQGPEQLLRGEQKSQEKMQAAAQADEAASRARDKLQTQQEKQAAHAARLEASGALTGPALPSGPSSGEQATYRESYAAKQAAAEKKRQEIAKRLKEKQAGKPVQPLPVQP
jgi:hypothetical protein